MSTRYSGFASRSFIMGSRLWPPAITRASGPCFTSNAMAPSTLSARSYSNGAGVCTRLPGRQPPARLPDVLALLVLNRRVRPDHGRARQILRRWRAPLRGEHPRREAAALDVAQHRPRRVAGGDRSLASEPRERQRAPGVDLADARRLDVPALRVLPEAFGRRAGVEALDEPHRVLHARLLHEHSLEQLDSRVEVLVDRVH